MLISKPKKHDVLVIAVLCLVLALFGCGDDSNDSAASGNNEEASNLQSQLIMDKIALAVVPGAWEAVTVTALDGDGAEETWEVASGDTDIAAVAVAGDQVTVTGIALGETILMLTSASGAERDIPVKVYSPLYLDVGEFIIGFVDEFEYRWHDGGSGGDYDGSFWHPVVPDDSWHALGSIGFTGYFPA